MQPLYNCVLQFEHACLTLTMHITVQLSALQMCTWKVQSSNPGLETGYPNSLSTTVLCSSREIQPEYF